MGSLLLLIYINDIPQAADIELLLYAVGTWLVFEHRNIKTIKQNINWDISTIVGWFVDNKLSVHFGEDKPKPILFSPKHISKSIGQIDISYKDVKIKKFWKVIYLVCVLDECLRGESMPMLVWKKIPQNWSVLYIRKGSFQRNKEVLRYALIQSNFNYRCATWYPNLNKKYKNKLNILQKSACISAYNWTTESTSDLNILTGLNGFQ